MKSFYEFYRTLKEVMSSAAAPAGTNTAQQATQQTAQPQTPNQPTTQQNVPGGTSSSSQVVGQERVNKMVNNLLPAMGPQAQQAWPNVQPQFWQEVGQKGYDKVAEPDVKQMLSKLFIKAAGQRQPINPIQNQPGPQQAAQQASGVTTQ